MIPVLRSELMNLLPTEALTALTRTEPVGSPVLSEELGVMARLAAAWGRQFGLDAAHVTPEARLTADLHFDSIDHVDALMAAEDEFDLVIENADVMQCITVADYVALIQRLLDTPAHAGLTPNV